MSRWEETGIACPCGNSSDAYSVDKNGRGFCFGQCGGTFFDNGVKLGDRNEVDTEYEFVPIRGLNLATVQMYDMSSEIKAGLLASTKFEYPEGGRKFRSHLIPKGRRGHFWTSGNSSAPNLYGMDKFAPGSKASITITEGEYDAASVWQMLNGVTAAVSVRSSSSVGADFAAHQQYINSFDRIVLAFDTDEVGQDALAEAAKFFDFKKVYVVKMVRKDANSYINSSDGDPDPETFVREWRNAKRYTPDSILSSFGEFEEALDEDPTEMLCDFPFDAYNESLQGLFAGQVVIIKGEEGIGKTEIFRAMEYHILQTTNHAVGMIHMEESNAVTLRGVATYELEQPCNDDSYVISNKDIMDAIKSATGGDAGRILLHSSNDVEDEDLFLDSLRYMLAVGKCRIIFLDHITWLATGNMEDDERKLLDKISQEIKKLAIIHNAAIVMISHVNDNGQTRGSRNMTKVADTVINLYRDKQNVDSNERNKLHSLAEKSRKQGTTTGPLGFSVYDRYTGMLQEHKPKLQPDEAIE